MTNEVRQAWQRFYAAALTAELADLTGYKKRHDAHDNAVISANIAARHYATLIPKALPQ